MLSACQLAQAWKDTAAIEKNLSGLQQSAQVQERQDQWQGKTWEV